MEVEVGIIFFLSPWILKPSLGGSDGNESACSVGGLEFEVGKIPWRRG